MHISFKDRLQELLLPKLQKKIGPDFEFEEDQDEDDEEYNTMIGSLTFSFSDWALLKRYIELNMRLERIYCQGCVNFSILGCQTLWKIKMSVLSLTPMFCKKAHLLIMSLP